MSDIDLVHEAGIREKYHDNGDGTFSKVVYAGAGGGGGGDASAANQASEIALLTTIDADTSRIPALGQAAMAASAPVVIASNQSAVPIAALPAGTNNIGDVDVLSLPGTVAADIAAMKSSLDALDNTVGGSELQVDIVSGGSSGVQYTEGDVDATITGNALLWEDAANTLVSASAAKPIPMSLATLPALVAGSANIGDVDVLTVPADPFGANADAAVAAGATGSISAKLRRISQSIEDLKTTAIVAGTANIGDVDVLTLPALPAGNNNVGDVDVATLPVAFNAGAAGATVVRTVTATDSPDAAGLGGTADAAATVGSTGSLNAKARLMTTLLDQIRAALTADPAVALHDNHDFTSTQTSTTLYTPTSGKKLALTSVRVSVAGTTAGLVSIYFGTGAITPGTNKCAIRSHFIPSATVAPGEVVSFPLPLIGVDDEPLKITTSAGMTIYVCWEGYEVD